MSTIRISSNQNMKFFSSRTVATVIITACISSFISVLVLLKMEKIVSNEDLVKGDLLNLVETHLLIDGKYEDLKIIKRDQIQDYVIRRKFKGVSEKDLKRLSHLVIEYYKKTGEEIPLNASEWVAGDGHP